ncbi:patched domain-containing protein 3-like [Centruroides sculpturatus]|uniref:patched domain-containing protein 3-like n=1 Tax=Centruroides sculpturatus TaxID=218467 RepID=UPI000C6E6E77|nr:patched domain-containing protein 3-like [Centruroides sculpturatus]
MSRPSAGNLGNSWTLFWLTVQKNAALLFTKNSESKFVKLITICFIGKTICALAQCLSNDIDILNSLIIEAVSKSLAHSVNRIQQDVSKKVRLVIDGKVNKIVDTAQTTIPTSLPTSSYAGVVASGTEHLSSMKVDCIKCMLTRIFENLGEIIARRPVYFIVLPVLLSFSLSIGILKLSPIEDIDDLVVADKGRAISTKLFVEKIFPFNSSVFYDMLRLADLPEMAIMFIVRKDMGDMGVKEVLEEIKKVDETIKNLTVVIDDVSIEYRNVCGIVRGNCFENPFSVLLSEINDLLTRRKKIKYPVEMDKLTLSYNVYSLNLGGVKTDRQECVESVKAIRLFYPFDITMKWKQKWIEQWTKTVYDEIGNSRFQHIKIFINPFWSIEEYAEILFSNLRPLIAAVVIFISAFSMITCMSIKLVRSKPWLGVASVVSAGLAISASFGLMGFFGTKNTYWNICIPFLVIVTEIDDAFVLIANWRITDPNDNVVNRLRNTYREAAVSITLTSLTNFLAYCVGMTTSFPLITFFGACMAISGYREEKGLHPITLRLFEPEPNSLESNESEEEIFMKIFKNQVGNILSFPITKVVVIILYFANLGLGIYGCFSIRHGIDWQNLFPDDSSIMQATNVLCNYFEEYGFALNIIINETLDYSDITVQQNMESLIERFQSHPHISDERFTISWLKYYKEFQEHPVAKYSLAGYNMSVKQDYLDGLRKVFLRFKGADEFSSDIVFNEDESDIICSRFFVIAKDVSGREMEIKFLDDMWKIAEEAPFTGIVLYRF